MKTISLSLIEYEGWRDEEIQYKRRRYTLFDNFRARMFYPSGGLRKESDRQTPWLWNQKPQTWHQINYRRINGGAMNDRIMLRRHLKYVSRYITQDAFWFHSSDFTPSIFQMYLDHGKSTGVCLHVGTIEAALYRRHPNRVDDVRQHLHVLRIRPEALVSPWWLADNGDPKPVDILEDKVYRYVNAYEGCGSVSLVGANGLFEYVDSISVPETNDHDRLWELPRSAQKKIKAYL